MDRAPAGIGGKEVRIPRVTFPGNQVASRNHRAVREEAKPLCETDVETPKIIQELVGKVGDQGGEYSVLR
jgi:hypothetical protein